MNNLREKLQKNDYLDLPCFSVQAGKYHSAVWTVVLQCLPFHVCQELFELTFKHPGWSLQCKHP